MNGLRDYNVAGQIGLEQSPDEYIAELVGLFRELRRVLRDDGTCWVNMGDSYGGGHGGNATNSLKQKSNHDTQMEPRRGNYPKQLMMIPARLALALQADGWWLRSEITWAKTAPMPESVTDRPTSATEKIYLLAKSPRYFYDQEAERVSQSQTSHGGNGANAGDKRRYLQDGQNGTLGQTPHQVGTAGRNLWNYWLISPEPYPGAHFAVFPSELPRRCISLATSARGVCPECGAPWVRVIEKTGNLIQQHWAPGTQEKIGVAQGGRHGNTSVMNTGFTQEKITTGWRPTCTHALGPIPATVLDPFLGSGTTSIVAKRLGRSSIGFELNPDYATMAQERIDREQPPLFVPEAVIEAGPEVEQLGLW